MSTVGQRERATQNRVVKLFRDTLGYDYLGNWEDRVGQQQHRSGASCAPTCSGSGYSEDLRHRAIFELVKTAGDQSKSLYDVNKAVYGLLRYGVQVKPDVGDNTETVRLIDWEDAAQQRLRHRRRGHRQPASTPSDPTSCSTSTASPWACWNSSAPSSR